MEFRLLKTCYICAWVELGILLRCYCSFKEYLEGKPILKNFNDPEGG
jgi:hypothetical protein